MKLIRTIMVLFACSFLLMNSAVFAQKRSKSPIKKEVMTNTFDGKVTTLYRAKGMGSLNVPMIMVEKKRDSSELITIYFTQSISSASYTLSTGPLESFEVLKTNGEIYSHPSDRLAFSAFDTDSHFGRYSSSYSASAILRVDKELLSALRDSKGYRLNGIGAGNQYTNPAVVHALVDTFWEDYPDYK